MDVKSVKTENVALSTYKEEHTIFCNKFEFDDILDALRFLLVKNKKLSATKIQDVVREINSMENPVEVTEETFYCAWGERYKVSTKWG